ncbi:MAG: hypothetical protein HOP33_17895 [Verrucomicrobia bacterium]|nr:hypothetical protein [Verrucomicrobiota bacterium]
MRLVAVREHLRLVRKLSECARPGRSNLCQYVGVELRGIFAPAGVAVAGTATLRILAAGNRVAARAALRGLPAG